MLTLNGSKSCPVLKWEWATILVIGSIEKSFETRLFMQGQTLQELAPVCIKFLFYAALAKKTIVPTLLYATNKPIYDYVSLSGSRNDNVLE